MEYRTLSRVTPDLPQHPPQLEMLSDVAVVHVSGATAAALAGLTVGSSREESAINNSNGGLAAYDFSAEGAEARGSASSTAVSTTARQHSTDLPPSRDRHPRHKPGDPGLLSPLNSQRGSAPGSGGLPMALGIHTRTNSSDERGGAEGLAQATSPIFTVSQPHSGRRESLHQMSNTASFNSLSPARVTELYNRHRNSQSGSRLLLGINSGDVTMSEAVAPRCSDAGTVVADSSCVSDDGLATPSTALRYCETRGPADILRDVDPGIGIVLRFSPEAVARPRTPVVLRAPERDQHQHWRAAGGEGPHPFSPLLPAVLFPSAPETTSSPLSPTQQASGLASSNNSGSPANDGAASPMGEAPSAPPAAGAPFSAPVAEQSAAERRAAKLQRKAERAAKRAAKAERLRRREAKQRKCAAEAAAVVATAGGGAWDMQERDGCAEGDTRSVAVGAVDEEASVRAEGGDTMLILTPSPSVNGGVNVVSGGLLQHSDPRDAKGAVLPQHSHQQQPHCCEMGFPPDGASFFRELTKDANITREASAWGCNCSSRDDSYGRTHFAGDDQSAHVNDAVGRAPNSGGAPHAAMGTSTKAVMVTRGRKHSTGAAEIPSEAKRHFKRAKHRHGKGKWQAQDGVAASERAERRRLRKAAKHKPAGAQAEAAQPPQKEVVVSAAAGGSSRHRSSLSGPASNHRSLKLMAHTMRDAGTSDPSKAGAPQTLMEAHKPRCASASGPSSQPLPSGKPPNTPRSRHYARRVTSALPPASTSDGWGAVQLPRGAGDSAATGVVSTIDEGRSVSEDDVVLNGAESSRTPTEKQEKEATAQAMLTPMPPSRVAGSAVAAATELRNQLALQQKRRAVEEGVAIATLSSSATPGDGAPAASPEDVSSDDDYTVSSSSASSFSKPRPRSKRSDGGAGSHFRKHCSAPQVVAAAPAPVVAAKRKSHSASRSSRSFSSSYSFSSSAFSGSYSSCMTDSYGSATSSSSSTTSSSTSSSSGYSDEVMICDNIPLKFGCVVPPPLLAFTDLTYRMRHPDVLQPYAESAVIHEWNLSEGRWNRTETFVVLSTEPFSSGNMRASYYMIDLKRLNCKLVAKRYLKNSVVNGQYYDDVSMHSISGHWARLYNAASPPKKVKFVPAAVLELRHRQPPLILAIEPQLDGAFRKYNNNCGYVPHDARWTPQAFSHFTYHASDHTLMVVDIQGVGDIYTDPQILSPDGEGYGRGNLGKKGIRRFLGSHRCNPVCKALGLPHIANGKRVPSRGSASANPRSVSEQSAMDVGSALRREKLPPKMHKSVGDSGQNDLSASFASNPNTRFSSSATGVELSVPQHPNVPIAVVANSGLHLPSSTAGVGSAVDINGGHNAKFMQRLRSTLTWQQTQLSFYAAKPAINAIGPMPGGHSITNSPNVQPLFIRGMPSEAGTPASMLPPRSPTLYAPVAPSPTSSCMSGAVGQPYVGPSKNPQMTMGTSVPFVDGRDQSAGSVGPPQARPPVPQSGPALSPSPPVMQRPSGAMAGPGSQQSAAAVLSSMEIHAPSVLKRRRRHR